MSEIEIGWWEWVQNAKDKVVSQSSEVLEFVKKDIEEFSKVVSEEASSAVSSTANSIKESLKLDDKNSSAHQVKQSLSGFFTHVAEAFAPSPEDDDQEALMIFNQQPVPLDRLQAAKYAFCSNPNNFLKEPESENHYELWLQSFKIELHENELPELLAENDSLRKCYSTVVPMQLSHVVFWHRYFYEIERLEKAEDKRQEMKRRAEATTQDEANIVWEDADEDLSEKVVISEQMQQQLLEDYEKEIQNNDSSSKEELPGVIPLDSPDPETNFTKDPEDEENLPEMTQRESKSSTPSSKISEDDWERVDDEMQTTQIENKTESTPSKGEDWENWE